MTVPPDFTVLGSGIPDPPTTTTTADGRPRRAFTFRALQPIRYLSIAVSRFVQVVSAEVSRRAATPSDDAAASPRLSRSGEGVFYDETVRRDVEPAAPDLPRQGPPRHDDGHRPLLWRPGGRPAVPEPATRAGRGHAARRPQPGVFRLAEPADAGHALHLGARPGGIRRLPAVLHRPRTGAPVLGTGSRGGELPRAVDQRRVRAIFCAAVRPEGPAEGNRRRRVPADVSIRPRGQRPGPDLARATGSGT